MVKKSIIDQSIKNKILGFARLLEKSGIKIEQIILYGSQVKGTAVRESDIDLCVVSPLFRKNFDGYFKKIWHLATKIDSSLEPIPFAPEDLSNRYSSLCREVKNYGIRII